MVPMILPKGIVLNTNYIYQQVAKYDTVPPEKIYEYWHVYTTTHRKLIDPTANRLENFWWHVMGSDRRFLSGPTLARLFEDISNGPTVVKLRGPPNRYEGPSTPNSPARKDNVTSSGIQVATQTGRISRKPEEGTPVKPLAASSSKPPPPHPILKKPRNPSASGSRPTARFVSPPDSEAEDGGKDSEAASSSSTTLNSAGDSKVGGSGANSKEERKRNTTPKKKTTAFVVSSSSKRRPAMPRRQSSVSSADGGSTGRDGSVPLGTKYLGSTRSVSPIAERPGRVAAAEEGGERLSAKAAGKRPVVKSASTKASASKSGSSSQGTISQEKPVVVQSDSIGLQPSRPKSESGAGPPLEVNRTRESTTTSSHRRSDVQERPRREMAPRMARSRSDMDTPRSRDISLRRRVPPQGLTSSSTTITSNVAAQGTILEFDDNAPAQEVTNALNSEAQVEDPETGLRRSGPSLHFTPTLPSNAPAVPLGRSKSQLTLLLEREKKTRR